MGTLVTSHVEKGALLDITVRVAPNEASVYQSLIDAEKPACPFCKNRIQPKPEDMHLLIYSPLNPLFGIDMGKPRIKCPSCGKDVEILVDMDLSAFPSVLQYVQRLRQEYKKKLQAKAKRSI